MTIPQDTEHRPIPALQDEAAAREVLAAEMQKCSMPHAAEIDYIARGDKPIPEHWLTAAIIRAMLKFGRPPEQPIDMLLFCPKCGAQHIDEPEGDWDNPPHRSHLCHACRTIWRPADVPTNGVVAISSIGNADTWAGGNVSEPARPTEQQAVTCRLHLPTCAIATGGVCNCGSGTVQQADAIPEGDHLDVVTEMARELRAAGFDTSADKLVQLNRRISRRSYTPEAPTAESAGPDKEAVARIVEDAIKRKMRGSPLASWALADDAANAILAALPSANTHGVTDPALRGLELTEDGYSLRTPFDGDVDSDGRHVVVGGETVITFADSDAGEAAREAILRLLSPQEREAGK
jgi:hypothetical protein